MAFATEENSRGSPDEIDSNTDDTIVRWQLNSLNCFKPVGKTNVLFPHCNHLSSNACYYSHTQL